MPLGSDQEKHNNKPADSNCSKKSRRTQNTSAENTGDLKESKRKKVYIWPKANSRTNKDTYKNCFLKMKRRTKTPSCQSVIISLSSFFFLLFFFFLFLSLPFASLSRSLFHNTFVSSGFFPSGSRRKAFNLSLKMHTSTVMNTCTHARTHTHTHRDTHTQTHWHTDEKRGGLEERMGWSNCLKPNVLHKWNLYTPIQL